MNFIPYIITAASIVGTVANSLQKRWCFFVWLGTNSFWCIYNVVNGSYAQALLYAFNFAMAILGLIKWRKIAKKERFIKCAECGGRATEFHHIRKFVPEGAAQTDAERLCNIKPLCASCHKTEHEKECSGTEGKKMNEELFPLKQPETFPAIEAAEKIVVSIDRTNGEDKTACIVAALDAVVKAVISAVEVVSEAVSTVQAYTETLLSVYPNKRVLHLAKYHPKERVRKKNMRRVSKWFERGL